MDEIKKIEINDSVSETIDKPRTGNPKEIIFEQKVEEERNNRQTPHKKRKWILVIPLVLTVFLLVSAIPAIIIGNKAKVVYRQALILKEAIKSKDLKVISKEVKTTKEELSSFNNSLKVFSPLRLIPIIGSYEADASHLVRAGELGFEAAELVIKAVEPYADFIGFSGGQTAGGGQKTAQDRVAFVVTTLEKIGPDLNTIGQKIKQAKQELDQINPNRYPEEFRGQKIKGPLTEVVNLVDQVSTLTNDAKPIIEVAPWLLGIDSPRRYLIVFQNDAELRPTGGFMTAYAILEVEKGKLKPILSEDIYDVDARIPSKERAPEALITYVTFPYKQDPRWRLRDMNISPDFKVSMERFVENFKKASSQKFDGVIAVDTKVLVSLLKVLGTVGVPDWGNFSAEPDKRCYGCPQVVYELERLADKPVNVQKTARKAVIGPLMHSVLANAFGSPKERIPGLVDAGFTLVMEKHVLFYFTDEKIQSAVEAFNVAGRVRDYEKDYFLLVDTSFSGAKTNLFIKQTVEQKVEVSADGTATKTVTVTYKNPFPPSDCNLERGGLCLNASYKDWFRFYVPKGSSLVESSGSDVEMKTYEELGKTVFEGFFGIKYALRPEGQTKLVLKYKLPFKVNKEDYQLFIQKQPGTDGHLYTIEAGSKKQEFELKIDKEVKMKI